MLLIFGAYSHTSGHCDGEVGQFLGFGESFFSPLIFVEEQLAVVLFSKQVAKSFFGAFDLSDCLDILLIEVKCLIHKLDYTATEMLRNPEAEAGPPEFGEHEHLSLLLFLQQNLCCEQVDEELTPMVDSFPILLKMLQQRIMHSLVFHGHEVHLIHDHLLFFD